MTKSNHNFNLVPITKREGGGELGVTQFRLGGGRPVFASRSCTPFFFFLFYILEYTYRHSWEINRWHGCLNVGVLIWIEWFSSFHFQVLRAWLVSNLSLFPPFLRWQIKQTHNAFFQYFFFSILVQFEIEHVNPCVKNFARQEMKRPRCCDV